MGSCIPGPSRDWRGWHQALELAGRHWPMPWKINFPPSPFRTAEALFWKLVAHGPCTFWPRPQPRPLPFHSAHPIQGPFSSACLGQILSLQARNHHFANPLPWLHLCGSSFSAGPTDPPHHSQTSPAFAAAIPFDAGRGSTRSLVAETVTAARSISSKASATRHQSFGNYFHFFVLHVRHCLPHSYHRFLYFLTSFPINC